MQYHWKVALSIVCLVTGLIAILYFSQFFSSSPTQPNSCVTTNSRATLTIDYGNGTVRTWANISITPHTSVFNLTSEVCVVSYRDYGWGYFLTGIDGRMEDSTHFWLYWVNGQYASKGSQDYAVCSGDDVLWNYTSD